MEAFWAITIIIVVVRLYWKHSTDTLPREEKVEPPVTQAPTRVQDDVIADTKAEHARKEIERQKEKEIAELKKQGYTDELIAIILPTINNGQ